MNPAPDDKDPVENPPRGRRWRPTFGQVSAALSFLGFTSLVFTAGAASMFFKLPPSGFLTEAFTGATSWARASSERSRAVESAEAGTNLDRPELTSDGFTLVTTTEGPGARLLDMRGGVVHHWKMPGAATTWEKSADVRAPRAGEPTHWERGRLFPNGDLLALCCAGGDTPYGYGLAKLDRDSNLIWGRSVNIHHDIDVGEDGRIYAVSQRHASKAPAGMDWLPEVHMADFLVVFSPDGKKLDEVPILEAFRDSPYLVTLMSGDVTEGQGPQAGFRPPDPGVGPVPPPPMPPMPGSPASSAPGRPFVMAPGDVLHTNSVKVLPKSLAAKFPLFKAGQVLLSLRSPSLLAVLDLEKRAIVWAAKGPWQSQHDACFLDNGRLLLFDNLGTSRGARVLEYDPATQSIPWSYAGEKGHPIAAPFRGGNQRLANGNTLFVYPRRGVIEVTREYEVAWRWGFAQTDTDASLNVTGARRYAPDELTFLKGVRDARPK